MIVIKKILRRILPKSAAYRLAAFLHVWRRWMFRRKVVQHTYCGHSLKLRIGDAMAQGWYDRDWVDVMIEIEELKKRKLKAGARVFDIGAHQGVVALIMSQTIGPTGQLIAVEADPWNAKAAEINRKLNSAKNIRVVHAAVVESDHEPDHEALSGLDRIFDWSQKAVHFRSLNSLANEHGLPDVVYIDVDGFEVAVLKGASDVLSTQADWFVEIHVGCGLENEGGTWEQILAFFPQERYTRLISSELHPSFVPFCDESPLLSERFFLLALSQPRPAVI